MQDFPTPDNFDEQPHRIQPDELDVLLQQIEAALATRWSGSHDTGEPAQDAHPVVVYIVEKPPMDMPSPGGADTAEPHQTTWTEPIIEGTLETGEPDTGEVPVWHDEAIDVDVPPPPIAPRRRAVGVLVALASLALVGLVLVGLFVVPPLTATASITILPTQATVTATTTLAVVTSGIAPKAGQVPGRWLSSLTMTGQRSVPTTGTGHQDAATAHGLLTFYNAATFTQTVPAGTLLTGNDGVQVVTDTDVVIPAASYPTFGQATVAAHAVQVGPSGNIGAGDIYGPCCRESVSAANSAFTGGQIARSYHMVAAQDVDTAVAALKATLSQSVQAALSAQVRPDETLIVPVACTPQVTTNHAVGDEASQVTVQLTETCTGETYQTQALQAQMQQAVTHTAMQQVGTGSTQEGDVQVSVQRVTVNTSAHGGITLVVKGTSVWAYQFTDAHLHQLSTRLAGKSRAEATAILLDTLGVSQVAMNVSGLSGALPTDPSRIHLLVLYQP